jgi:hypothetical protein
MQNEFQTKKKKNYLEACQLILLKCARVIFEVAGQTIPTVLGDLVKSIDRVYDSSLTDAEVIRQIVALSKEGLLKINRCRLLGNFKVLRLQFMVAPNIVWPLPIYKISLSTVETMEMTIFKYTRK